MSKIYVFNSGLGDFINLSSAIAQLSKKELILLPLVNMVSKAPFPSMKKRNIETFLDGCNIKLMDVNPNADIFDLIDKWQGRGFQWFVKRGCTANDFQINDHIKEVYELLGIDYETRVTHSPIPENANKIKQLPIPTEPYAFIPEGGSTGQFKIDRKYVTAGLKEVIPPQDALMLEWADIIINATEIHSHDCGWWALINALNTKGKVFFHLYARPECLMYDYNTIYPKKYITLK
jgi:hypothetical protein